MNFEPETARTQWLNLADRYQLERDLDNLPELAAQLEHNYDALLSLGDRDPTDSAIRYVTRFDVLDLADRRVKWERSANRTEPLTLADRDARGPSVDPAWWADLARRIGARRLGILPTLASWVSLTVGEMHDAEAWHLRPADPDQVVWVATTTGEIHATKPGPTVASEAGWLRRHLDWIVEQQWATELADEVHRIVADLDSIGISHHRPDPDTVGTIPQLAAHTGIPAPTIYRWTANGWLQPIPNTKPRHYYRRDLEALRSTSSPAKSIQPQR